MVKTNEIFNFDVGTNIPLDEIDSGLDIDALKLYQGVNAMRGEGFDYHYYQRLLNYITPDGTRHDGRSCCLSGGPELAARLEREGYAKLAKNLATTTRKNCNSSSFRE